MTFSFQFEALYIHTRHLHGLCKSMNLRLDFHEDDDDDDEERFPENIRECGTRVSSLRANKIICWLLRARASPPKCQLIAQFIVRFSLSSRVYLAEATSKLSKVSFVSRRVCSSGLREPFRQNKGSVKQRVVALVRRAREDTLDERD